MVPGPYPLPAAVFVQKLRYRFARLTGAGFGGCAISLVASGEASALADSTRRRFEEEGFEEPAFYEFRPVAGAEVAG